MRLIPKDKLQRLLDLKEEGRRLQRRHTPASRSARRELQSLREGVELDYMDLVTGLASRMAEELLLLRRKLKL